MPGGRIKGITVEIDGSTTGLDKALKSVDKTIGITQSSLKDVNRLLKLDPKNTELLQQKQKLLAEAVDDTSRRLDALKKASEDAAKTAGNYDAWKNAFEPIQSEIDKTKERANELRAQMANMKEVGEIDTDAYKDLQTELKETNDKLKNLQQQAKDVNNEFGNPISPKQYDALQREIIETEQKLNGLKSESEVTSAAIEGDFKSSAKGTDTLKESIDGIGDTVKSGVLIEATEQLEGLGDKITDIGGSAIESFNEMNDASAKASAYFGETGKAAENTAAVIKDVYEGGVGDSMDTVANAVISVKKNLGDLDRVTLTNLTEQAITLDELYGIDMDETLRGTNALMQNFGMTAQEAMDYIVTGTQNGLDKTNELGDNLSEYSGKFSQAGYSAQEYFQLLNNGLDGGAYNLDKVNDAINEVTTRLADGTIGENIGMYSEKTQELFNKWKDGGATQKEVIDSIVADIAGTTNQQEALNKAAQAFGTMAEDGNLKFITSLTSVGSTYDDVSGKAQGMFEATSTPAQEMEANMRQLKDTLIPLGEQLSEVANDIIPPLVSGISQIAQWFASLPAPVQITIGVIAALVAGISQIAPLITALKALGLPAALSGIGTAITGTVLPAIGSGIAAFGSFLIPILPIIAAIGSVIAVGVLLYKNWDTIKEKAAELKDSAINKFNELKSKGVEKFNALKTGAAEKFNSMKADVANKASALKTDTINKFNSMKTDALSKIESLKSGAVNKFQNIKTGISEKMEGARDKVGAAIEKIKGFFNFSWSLPHLKMPHPTISGHFSLNPPSVPKFSISWYKKAYDSVMALDSPTLFGYSDKTGRLLGGGDGNGREIVSGEEHMVNLIDSVVNKRMGGVTGRIEQLTAVVQKGFPSVIKNMERDVVLNDGTMVGKFTPKIDAQLGKEQRLKERYGK